MGRPIYLALEEGAYIVTAPQMEGGHSIPSEIITMAEIVKHVRDTLMPSNSNIIHKSMLKHLQHLVAHVEKNEDK